MNKIFLYISLLIGGTSFSQPGNDDCADATALTIDGGLSCGQTATDATAETGECVTNWAGNGNSTVWFSFTADNDSLVINYVETVTDGEMLAVYGPGATCQPACATQIYEEQQVGDPGHHILLTGLTVGGTYLIQVDATDPNSPNDPSNLEFCMGIATPDANAVPGGANLLDECGTAFTETTDGGYWQSGTGTGFNNLDGNAGTTCSGCPAGDDTPFIINNAAWNTFCSLTAGTWQITVDNITNCNLAAPNAGIQASVFTGTTTALVNEDNSASPQAPSTSWTSSIITVDSAECAFLMIDGFAGDVCSYDVTLTNITGGCAILDVEFMAFNAYRNGGIVEHDWKIASELNNDYFILEKSYDGENFREIGKIVSIGNHSNSHEYYFKENNSDSRNAYYRLSEVNNDGLKSHLAIKYLKGNAEDNDLFTVYPNPASSDISFEFNNNGRNQQVEFLVYNLSGELVYSSIENVQIGFNVFNQDVSLLEQGSYLVKLVASDKVWNTRFTVVK
jgi:hypothetical protein